MLVDGTASCTFTAEATVLVESVIGIYIWVRLWDQALGVVQGMDAYQFAEPANVLSELGKEFWEGLAATKWSERRDALAKLRMLASAPKLGSGDYGDVNRQAPWNLYHAAFFVIWLSGTFKVH